MDRTELATFLRAHRARLRPADVGLPAGTTRRRTPGLRREEVAELSGVGITWYTWLELAAASPEFRRWWPDYPIREFKPATIAVDHPDAGRIALDIYQLRPVEYPDLLLVTQVPATADDAERVRRLLGEG